jgi:diguanylate cyclase (GGDEF)-like protein
VYSSPFKRLDWATPDPATADPRDRATMARVFAYLYGAGATMVLISLALPHDPERHLAGILIPVLVAYAVVAVLVTGFDRLPPWSFHAFAPLGTVILSFGIYFAGGATVAAYAMAYLWVVLATFFFFGLREGLANLAFVAIAYGVVLAVTPQVPDGEIRWLMAIGTLTAGGLLIASLRGAVAGLISLLRRRARRQEAVAKLGTEALASAELAELVEQATSALADNMAADCTAVFEWVEDSDELLMLGGSGWAEGAAAAPRIPVERGTRRVLAAKRPLVERFDAQGDVFAQELMQGQGLRSGISVAIWGSKRPWGIVGAYSRSEREFPDDDANFIQSVAIVLANAIERRRAEEESLHHSLYDPLTGTPNRTLFLERLEAALERTGEGRSRVALLLLDIDNFKAINDGFGHGVGDELLKVLPERLREALVLTDTLARFGGDEFAILCEGVGDEADAAQIAERLLATLARPLEFAAQRYRVGATIGVALSDGTADAGPLVGQATAARASAKERTPGRYEVFDQRLRRRMRTRLSLENALRAAIENRELRLAYQPIVRFDGPKMRGCEALLRWEHSGLGPVSPIEFIPVAEESGAIVPIGEWALEAACGQIAAWSEVSTNGTSLPVHVNVSARQLAQADFAETVERVLSETGARASDLALEITEHALIAHADNAATTLRALRTMGAAIVLDDFGTGYSSLSHLKQFPIDMVKVDRLFVSGLKAGSRDAAIVGAILRMAESFGMEVVAEGIETSRQIAVLRELGCRFGQGYYYGAAVTPQRLVPETGDSSLETSPS